MKRTAILLSLLFGLSAPVGAATFVISHPRQVEDCILRRSEVTYHDEQYWTGWNFGASQTLDAGYGIAMWNMWRGNILVRFDLHGIDCREVSAARFRIYKPRNITQTSPEVPVAVYAVKECNAAWREGSMESMPQHDAASWLCRSDGEEWAGGPNGCSVAGVDHDAEPLGRAAASKYRGEWLEFEIPAALVRQWIEAPEKNAGLLIKTDAPEEVMGDHVLFYSSEHASGKGPQLVVEGRRGKAKFAADPAKRCNPRYVMPRQDSTFRRYLRERNFRYVNWTTDPVVGLRDDQRIYPYYWDVVVYGEYILPNAYYPFSQSILGLDGMIERQDREGLRRFQINRLRYLHIWEYTREQRWYDCGDIIEIFSPLQAAYIWLGSKKDNGLTFDGVLNKVHPKGRKNLSRQEIQLRRLAEVEECVRNLDLTPVQYDSVERFISRMEELRCIYFNKCNDAAQEVHRLLAEKNDGREMIDALGTFMNCHDIYLFYDSYWQMKRWAFLMDHTDMVAFNKFWKRQKFGEYSPERIEKRYRMCADFYPRDRGPLPIEIKNRLWPE